MPNGSPELLLDVSRLVWRAWDNVLPTGIDRTCLAYLAHFRDRASAVVQRGDWTRILSPAVSQRLFHILLEGGPDSRQALLRLSPYLLRDADGDAVRGQLYLNVGHTGIDKRGHTQWLMSRGVRPVYFVHDLIPLSHPEYCRPGEAEKHRIRLEALLRHGAGVIANSRDTLNELGLFASLQQGRTTPPGLVAPLGADNERFLQGATQQILPGRPYFVLVGTIEGRKNHLLILNIWAEMARRLGASCPQLVIIGKRGWESEQAVDMLDRCEALLGHVIELPRCDDATLGAYLRDARALLFPSFVEGYGLPLVEALALGTPVIASDLPVFRELAGAIPDYLSPIDGLGWRGLIENYSGQGSRARDAQMERLKDFSAPLWSVHFEKVERWLEHLPT